MNEEQSFLFSKLLSFKQNSLFPGILDVEVDVAKISKHKFDFLECHIVLYPYSRNVKANNFHFHPYEEYV